MMRRKVLTLICIFALVVFSAFFSVNYAHNTPNTQNVVTEQYSKYDDIKPKAKDQNYYIKNDPSERFLSFLPHGGFATQHEAVRNAFRIALETKRSIILPQLRLGTKSGWLPFPTLAKFYESQDKNILHKICKQNQTDWRIDHQPCRNIDDWIEVPWSTFFDLDAVRQQFDIRIYERTSGHSWGFKDELISQLKLKEEDVVVLDPTSFPSNGTDWEQSDQFEQKIQRPLLGYFFNKNEENDEERKSIGLRSALKSVIKSEQWTQLNQRYIQFGSLVYGLRFQTSTNKEQDALKKALRSDLFVSPNQFNGISDVAHKIANALGGNFGVIHMTFETLVLTEVETQKATRKEAAAIEGRKYVDTIKTIHPDGTPYTTKELLQELGPQTQTDFMHSLVREFNGEMPINQAVSATLPIKKSTLKDLLTKGDAVRTSRKSLLSACIQYRREIDAKYPIYYLTNDVYEDIIAHAELFQPIIDALPCTFTRNDMYQWGIIQKDWVKQLKSLNDTTVDYEKLFSPIVDILVARQGYSFFEVPTTKLTRLLSWHS